MKFASYLRH